MQVSENPDAAVEFVRRAHAADEAARPRDLGLHATDLVFCPRKTYYRLQDEKASKHLTPTHDQMLAWLVGNGHHQLLQGINPEFGDLKGVFAMPCQKTGEPHLITMNLDFLDPESGPVFYHIASEENLQRLPTEIKTTRKSSACEITDLPWYVEQIVTYLFKWGRVARDQKVHARLAVVFLSGNYKDQNKPILRVWDLVFTLPEIKAWSVECHQRVHRILDMRPGSPAPERYVWECGYCEYQERCPWPEASKGRSGDKTGIKKTGYFTP